MAEDRKIVPKKIRHITAPEEAFPLVEASVQVSHSNFYGTLPLALWTFHDSCFIVSASNNCS